MARYSTLFVLLLAMVSTASRADTLKKGNVEFDVTFSYNTVDPDGGGDDVTTTNLAGSLGYLLTDSHEIGGRLSYFETEVGDESVDATRLGVFYNYNFGGFDSINPYLGASVSLFSGDLGDVYDNSIGVEGGVKIWPWANAGFNLGASYEEFAGAGDFEDASSLTVFGGIAIKF